MNLLQEINDRVAMDPESAKEFFGLKKKPDAKWVDKIEPGVAAAQCIIDAQPPDATPPPEDIAVATGAEAFGLGAENEPAQPEPTPAPEQPQLNGDLLAQLRARLRVAADADMSVCIQAALAGAWSRKVMMLTPLALPVLPWVHFSHLAQLRTQPWLGYHQETDTLVAIARNRCAAVFLNSEAEWAWFVDGDIVPSHGDLSLFYNPKYLGVPQNRIGPDYIKTKTLDRLMRSGQKLVGAVYQQRRKGGAVCSPIDLRPNPTVEEKDAVLQIRNKGPRDKIIPVDWCATGCLLIHRSVFDDIKRKRPDLGPQNPDGIWNFFGHDVGRMGEDAAFGILAKECGHQSYLDLGCWVAHVGNYAFMPEPI